VLLISLCFFFLPFTYFYAEEKLESDDADLDFDLDLEDFDDDNEYSST
jgi:hypothetical protein